MRTFLPKGIVFVTLLCFFVVPSFAQGSNSASDSSNESGSPFEVTIVPATQADYDACSGSGFVGKTNIVGLAMRNAGDKPLRGYVVAVWYHDVGSRIVTHSTVSKLIHPGDPMIEPGAEWHGTACGLSKVADLEDPKAQVDFLMYADGETWGPDELVESNRLDGVSIGMNFAAGGDDQQRGYVTPTPVAAEMVGQPISMEDGPRPNLGGPMPLIFFGKMDRDDAGNLLLVVQATNTGEVPVVGYYYSITFYDRDTHDAVKRVGTKTMETHGNAVDYLQPGATWASGGRKIPASENGEADTYTVTLDAVVLADGTVRGPLYSRESDELVGMVEGIGAVHVSPCFWSKAACGGPIINSWGGGVVGGTISALP
jgi:hypothetical protein